MYLIILSTITPTSRETEKRLMIAMEKMLYKLPIRFLIYSEHWRMEIELQFIPVCN
jgi:hypothetical protein